MEVLILGDCHLGITEAVREDLTPRDRVFLVCFIVLALHPILEGW